MKQVRHELTVPYTPEQNGVSERMNRTLMESARTMMARAGLPDSCWAEAVAAAAYVRNRTPTRAFKEPTTPYERWYGRLPNVAHLRVFGCTAYAHVPDAGRQKLDDKAEKFRFVGYCKVSKGYRLLNEKNKKVVVQRDVSFDETNFGSKTSEESTEIEVNAGVDASSVEERSMVEPRRSGRDHRHPIRFGIDEYCDRATVNDHTAYHVRQIEEPKTIQEALSSDLASEWKSAADSEYLSLMENLVELPPGKIVIGSKWVFKVKYKSDGRVERFKARLVAKGYSQKYGVD